MLGPTPIDVKRFSTPIKVISRKPSCNKRYFDDALGALGSDLIHSYNVNVHQ